MFRKILDRLFVVSGALFFFQFPLFMNQYQLQLSGHVNELHWQVLSMQKVAKQTDKSLEQYIKKFVENEDHDFSSQGKIMVQTRTRWINFTKSLEKLQNASVFTRPFIFFFYVQWDIIKSTASSFQPGVSFSTEGIVYALLGMLVGYLIFQLIAKMTQRISFLKK